MFPRIALVAASIAASAATLAVSDRADAQGLVVNLPWLGPTAYTFTNTTLATYRAQNFDTNVYDDNFASLTERFDSALVASPWRLQVRIDGFAPIVRMPSGNTADNGVPLRYLGMPAVPLPAGEIFTGSHLPNASGCSVISGCDYLRPDVRLERVLLRYARGPLTAEVGDYYFVIGRGIALAFRKVDPLGLDTSIRGAHADVDVGRFTLRGFGGYANPQNLDPITLRVDHDWGGAIAGSCAVDPTTHRVADACTLRPGPDSMGGADIAVRLGAGEEVELGAHALALHFPDSLLHEYDVLVGGYRVDAPALLDGRLSLYGEVDALRRRESTFALSPGSTTMHGPMASQQNDRVGRAIFASAQYSNGGWTLLAEWKDYTNYYVSPDGSGNDIRRVYSAAPSLERDDVQFRTNANVRGGRVRIERAFRPSPWIASITAVGNGFAEETDHDPWDPTVGVGALHGYLTLRRRGRTVATTVTPPASSSAAARRAAATASTQAPAGEAGASTVTSAATGGLGGSGARVAAGEWNMLASVGFRYEGLLGAHCSTPDANGFCASNASGYRAPWSPDWHIAHGDIDVSVALGINDSIEARLDVRHETRWSEFIMTSPIDSRAGFYNYWRGGLAVTWAHTDRFSLSGVLRYDTTQSSQGVNVTRAVGFEPLIPDWYPGGEVRYMFAPGDTLRFFAGMTPGGRLCTGGVCRDVPPFQGGIVELVLRL